MSDVKGEAGGVWLREKSVGSNEVRVVDTPAVRRGWDVWGGRGDRERGAFDVLMGLFLEHSITYFSRGGVVIKLPELLP